MLQTGAVSMQGECVEWSCGNGVEECRVGVGGSSRAGRRIAAAAQQDRCLWCSSVARQRKMRSKEYVIRGVQRGAPVLYADSSPLR